MNDRQAAPPSGSQGLLDYRPANKAMMDPRARRSQAALIQAMTEILDESDATPNVTDVVKRAGASRPTFYQHFGDVGTLMHAAALARLEGLMHVFASEEDDETAYEDPGARIAEHLGGLFSNLAKHRDFYRRVLTGPASIGTLSAIVSLVTDYLTNKSTMLPHIRKLAHDDEAQAAEFTEFLAAGITQQVFFGLINDESPEQVAKKVTRTLALALALPY